MPKAFYELFSQPLPVIAVIHTGPSPGTPGFVCMESVVDRALAEAEIYAEAGVDGILLKNLFDVPCVPESEMGPEVPAFMTRVAHCIKHHIPQLPVGIQVMCYACRTSMAVALAADGDFVRVDGWEHTLSGNGQKDAVSAGSALRYRYHIRANHIPAFADVDTYNKNGTDPAARAEALAWHKANAIVATGGRPGIPPDKNQVQAIRAQIDLPILIGSGMTRDTLPEYADIADGFIIGSGFKEHGIWNAPVCQTRAHDLMQIVKKLRRKKQPVSA